MAILKFTIFTTRKVSVSVGEDVEKREPVKLLVGMQTSTATMENSVEIP